MDESDKFKDLNKILEAVEKSSVKSKDYIKFVIGLSTGVLVFSGTFYKEFIKSPQFKFILIIAWACLFVSIILGVWILPMGDRLQGLIESLKNLFGWSPEKIKSLTEKKLKEYYLKDWIKQILPSAPENDERVKNFYESLETVPLKDLVEALKKLSELGVKEPDKLSFVKEFAKEILNFFSLIKLEERTLHPLTLLKNFRNTIWQLLYLEKAMRLTFFIGMFAILIFSIINLLH